MFVDGQKLADLLTFAVTLGGCGLMVQGDILSFLGELKNVLLIQSFVDNLIGNITIFLQKVQ